MINIESAEIIKSPLLLKGLKNSEKGLTKKLISKTGKI
jgi:hypothetical protein